ncbi:uncharacterized protein METZ01_LOCUS351434, partial [marine metagenome]
MLIYNEMIGQWVNQNSKRSIDKTEGYYTYS